MQTSCTSIIRHSSSATLASFLRCTSVYHGGCGFGSGAGVGTRRSFYFLSAKRENPNVSRKNFLRAFCAPVLSSDEEPSPLFKSKATGTVVTAQANYMRVIVQREAIDGDGDESSSSKTAFEILCEVRTMLMKLGKIVLVGDRVLVEDIDWIDRRGIIVNLFDRRSENVDPPVANVDHLLVFFSLDEPKLKPDTLTRFLVQAESSGIPFTLALNKCELINQEELESWRTRLRGWNYEPLFCSVETKVGLGAIATNLRNKTSVIVGPSGVGKSSLINVLRSMEGEIWFEPIVGLMYEGQKKKKKKKWFEDQRVDQVSKNNGKGIHTTRNVTLMQLSGGGYIADTPGSNRHKLLKVTKQSLPLCFPEIRKMTEGGKCEFSNCSHIDVPGCAVLEGDWERYTYYLQLLDEIRTEEESQLKKYGTTKKEGGVRYKVGGKYVKQAQPLIKRRKKDESDDE